jgi:PKD repeat protein
LRVRWKRTLLAASLAASVTGTAGCLVFVVSGPGTGLADSGVQQVNLPDGGIGFRLPDGGIVTTLVEAVCTAFPASGPPGTEVYFDGNGSQGSPGASVVSWSWTFGDGASSSGAAPSHVYTDAGTYAATLTATDDSVPPASSTITCPSVTITP